MCCAKNEKDINMVGFYQDDGCSGTNFERPDFKLLLDDVKMGKINFVITKDLSRFGRNYVDTGYYIEQVFDGYNVRYIAIDAAVDSRPWRQKSSSPFACTICGNARQKRRIPCC